MNNKTEQDLLVIKIGTNVLVKSKDGQEALNDQAFASIGKQINKQLEAGKQVILVTSGAISAGVIMDGKKRSSISTIAMEQRYAARGWHAIVRQWQNSIGENRVSSTLLTKREIRDESMRNKLFQALKCCLDHGDVFVVNENDCLSDDEIKFGDNDMLAATLARECQQSGMFSSVKLILLTNKYGLNKVAEDDRTIIREVTDISSVEQFAGSANNNHSRGGMITKINAAKLATGAGIETYITSGLHDEAIVCVLDKQIGTYFCTSII